MAEISELDNSFNESRNAFRQFVKYNLDNPVYKDKIVAFVHGKLEGVGDSKSKLIATMHDKFGNVDMYVGQVTRKRKTIRIDTPELDSY